MFNINILIITFSMFFFLKASYLHMQFSSIDNFSISQHAKIAIKNITFKRKVVHMLAWGNNAIV